MKLKLFTILSFLLLFPHQLQANELYIPAVPTNQSDLRNVDFYLMTVGSGRKIADVYGHFGIRVDDRVSGIDSVYHWGKYSFDSPLFLWDFYRGELTYEMTIWPLDSFVSVYEKAQRSLIQDKLNLTLEQKNALYQKLRWNSFPENRKFSYQYWTSNCATVPRDYLNDVLLGNLKSSFETIQTSKTYRAYIADYLGQFTGVDLITDVLVGPRVDRSLNAWEAMFLPSNIQKNLSLVNRVDDAGQSVAGAPLISKSERILEFPRQTSHGHDYLFMSLLLFGGLGIGLCLKIWGDAHTIKTKSFNTAPLGMRVIGLVTTFYGIVAVILGTAIASNHFFSGHPDTFANANIFLLSPLDFVYIIIGLNLLLSGTNIKDRFIFARGISTFFALRVLAIGLLGIGLLTGYIAQDVTRSIMLFGSFNIALNFALVITCISRFPFKEPKANNARDLQQPVSAK